MREFKNWLHEFVESLGFKIGCFVLDVVLIVLLVLNLVN